MVFGAAPLGTAAVLSAVVLFVGVDGGANAMLERWEEVVEAYCVLVVLGAAL